MKIFSVVILRLGFYLFSGILNTAFLPLENWLEKMFDKTEKSFGMVAGLSDEFETFLRKNLRLIKRVSSNRLHRYWRRMLETKCVGDNFEMLVTVLELSLFVITINTHRKF